LLIVCGSSNDFLGKTIYQLLPGDDDDGISGLKKDYCDDNDGISVKKKMKKKKKIIHEPLEVMK